MGDPLGIGPEIIAKAAAARDRASEREAWLVFGRAEALHEAAATCRVVQSWRVVRAGDDRAQSPRAGEIVVVDDGAWRGDVAPRRAPARGPDALAGRASFGWVERAIDAVKRPAGDPWRASAIVTAPIAKEAWKLAGEGGDSAASFPGHTELLADRFASPRSAMMFVGPTLRVILVTIHVPLARVPGLLTAERIFDAIDLGARACREMGLNAHAGSPRVAVAGLNPHAGEGGMFGTEDVAIIAPAIARARAAGIDATGPWPGDAVFLDAVKGRYDLVVAMYHDQGLIPVKLVDRAKAVNVTVGLRHAGRAVIRTSPAHGTAFDISGQGKADASSMIEAIALARQMATR